MRDWCCCCCFCGRQVLHSPFGRRVPRPTEVLGLPCEAPRIFAQTLRGHDLLISQVKVASEEYGVHGFVCQLRADGVKLQVAEGLALGEGLQVRRCHEEGPSAASQVQAHGHQAPLHLRR